MISNRYYTSFHVVSDPGQFEFEKPSFLFKESVGVAKVPVLRIGGTDGACSVCWRAIFVPTNAKSLDNWGSPDEGKLNFLHGEASGTIELNINDNSKEKLEKSGEKAAMLASEDDNRSIQLLLTNPTNGAKVGKRKTTVVTIVSDDGWKV